MTLINIEKTIRFKGLAFGFLLAAGCAVAPMSGFGYAALATTVSPDLGGTVEGGGDDGHGGGHNGCGPHFTVDDWGVEHHGHGGGGGGQGGGGGHGGGGGGGHGCGGGDDHGGHDTETDDYGNPIEDDHDHDEA